MIQNDNIFNIPDFVSNADPKLLDATDSSASVVVGGHRLDNPAAVWMASASLRKSANNLGGYVANMIKQASDLFGISDDMFVEKQTSMINISDGEHSASFNVYDNESLNKAASSLKENRASLPYPFAQECSETLKNIADAEGYVFNKDNEVFIRKLAGDYNTDFITGKKALEYRIKKAQELGLKDYEETLTKIANLCTPDCSPSLAPYFVAAADEFDRSVAELRKTASTELRFPEDAFYISTDEYLRKKASIDLVIDDTKKVARGSVLKNTADGTIRKWASDYGYNISQDSTPEETVSIVQKMPEILKEEFLFILNK